MTLMCFTGLTIATNLLRHTIKSSFFIAVAKYVCFVIVVFKLVDVTLISLRFMWLSDHHESSDNVLVKMVWLKS